MGGGDVSAANMTVPQATAWCRSNSHCKAFIAQVPAKSACASTVEVMEMHFKDGWAVSPAVGDDCHFADALSPSLLKHLLKVEGGAAE